MQTIPSNVFTRDDTFFGVCQAIGEDFGFNPLWLRLAFPAPLFFFPVQTIAAYFALGALVLLSRLIVREPRQVVETQQEEPAALRDEASPERARAEAADPVLLAA